MRLIIKKTINAVVIGAAIIAAGTLPSRAGVPLTNLEGVGGIAFNPLAYTAGTPVEGLPVNKPQFGGWYVRLGDVKVDWTSIGAAETVFKRLEVSGGYETIAQNKQNIIHKNNYGAKLNVLDENAGGTNYVPAISVGAIYKHTDAAATNAVGADYYGVATKLIKELPRPVLVSAGALSTKAHTTGVFGFDKDRKTTFFGNIDVLPVSVVALGFEYKQGAEFSDFKNASYWDAHAAWFYDPHLTLVAAYVNAGDEKSTTKVGLGKGVVLSAQYAF